MANTTAAFVVWLQVTRKQAGLSQQKVADALTAQGIQFSQTQIARIERGERGIQLDEAVALVRMFGTTLDSALSLHAGVGSVAAERAARRTALLSQLRNAIDAELRGETP